VAPGGGRLGSLLRHLLPWPRAESFRAKPRLASVLPAAAAAAAVVVLAAGCASTVPDRLTIPFGDAQQLVVVTAPSWSSTTGVLTTYERAESGWRIVHSTLPARLGRSGFNPDHREGDGTTPAGSFSITGIMGRQPNPGVRYPYRPIVPGDCWISDVASPAYNQLVAASPCVSPNEDLYAIGAGPYRYLATIGYNTNPIVPGAGSAIFLHRHHHDSAGRTVATSGCVSLSEPDLLAVLRWLDPAKQPRILMGPDAWLVRP
jgi:L,D-peptidoglycan transpeptidase YkuD (ErfK/YbiS/YcfS/YnhG family)